jgi:glycosyltransferase involved in cell wall biosynthesis
MKIRNSFLHYFPGIRIYYPWLLAFLPWVIRTLKVEKVELVISSSHCVAKAVRVPPGAQHICYCHTPTRYLWSDSWEYIVELQHNNFLVKKLLPFLLTYLRLWDYHAARRVDVFIANSHFVAERIKRFYHKDSSVIYPPVETAKYRLVTDKRNYFAVMSRLRPYKRVELAIEAFNEMRIPLKIIGGGWEISYLKKRANKNIEFLGEILDVEKKNRIIGHAKALIHPQEEDFGIAAVEAMSCGTPVIAYGRGGARETVLENKTGVFFEDQTWESLAAAVLHFQKKQFDYAAIQQHAAQFSEERFRTQIKQFVSEKYEQWKGQS